MILKFIHSDYPLFPLTGTFTWYIYPLFPLLILDVLNYYDIKTYPQWVPHISPHWDIYPLFPFLIIDVFNYYDIKILGF